VVNKNTNTDSEFRYSILCISGYYFGVEVKYVREVQLLPVITKVPNVHKSILGVFNLRGQIQSIVDVRGILNLPSGKISEEDFVVVVEHNKRVIGVLVEKVLDVFTVDPGNIQIPTREMSLSLVNYCSGYCNHKKLGKIFLLDLDSIFNAKEIGSTSFSRV
jgi:purine-binding chemotaxis protein CheW